MSKNGLATYHTSLSVQGTGLFIIPLDEIIPFALDKE